MKTVLIVGATGLVGDAALAHFCGLEDWQTIALSRRPPHSPEKGQFQHVSLDLSDSVACQNIAPQLAAVTHIVYAAVAEKPGLVAGWQDKSQMQLNLDMLANLLTPLVKHSPHLQHVSLLQGAKAYGAHAGHQPPIPARETDEHRQHDNFYWLQEDYLRQLSSQQGFTWTIFRPQVIIGAAHGAAMNPLLPLVAYAAVRSMEGKPFSYPGGATQISELVDAGLLAKALQWAAESDKAKNQTFNFTNGDVFSWRCAWPEIARQLNVVVGPDEPQSLANYLESRHELWDSYLKKENLPSIPLAAFLGESHHYIDILLRRDATQISRPTLLTTIKIRQAGFSECIDTYHSLNKAFDAMRKRQLLP